MNPAGEAESERLRGRLPEAGILERLSASLGPLVVVDLETTGLDPDRCQIIEVGALRLESGQAVEFFHRFVDPQEPLPEFVRDLTGIDEPMLEGAESWERVGPQFARWIQGATLVAHNVEFEKSYLRGVASASASWLDTLELACILRPELATHDLDHLSRQLLGRREEHRALADAVDAMGLMAKFQTEIDAGEHDELLDVLAVARDDWGWAGLFGLRSSQDLGPLSRVSPSPPPGDDGPLRSSGGLIDSEALASVDLGLLLGDEEALGREIPGYRVRDGQVELTEAIAKAFREEKALAIEAGTGIGKTLGYALAAFLHAGVTGERVVISSANRTLQERVVAEELPALARALGVPPVQAVVLKGRANYGNPQRAREAALGPVDGASGGLGIAARLFLVSYFARCPLRDLQGFGGWLAHREEGLRRVRERIACGEDCDLRACRREAAGACAYLARVDALAQAGIVSINHSLLLSWPGRYGPIERLVIDEAHELVGEGDRAFGETLESRELRANLRRVGLRPKGSAMGALAVRAGRSDLLEEMGRALGGVEAGVDALGTLLQAAIGGAETPIPPRTLLPQHGPWVDLEAGVDVLVTELSRLAGLLEEIAPSDEFPYEAKEAGGSRSTEGSGLDALSREGVWLARYFRGVAAGVLADVFDQKREEHVYAARMQPGRKGPPSWSFSVTPLQAADLIHARVLESPKTVVALSATLGIGGDPTPTLEKLGWALLPRHRRLDPLMLPSPFDFENHAVVGLVEGADYRERGFEHRCADAAAAVGRLLGGRTLALFTSRRRLYEVARLLRERLADEDLQILVQPPTGGAAALVERFSENHRSILLGTRSLWQGIDIPGAALSCVLIDKFPFPQPNDPLLQGRSQRLRALGENAFRSLSLEPAVVLFKQMFGRLVRSETDRGFVIVLGADTTKPYVDDFLDSLPGPPRIVRAEMASILNEMRVFFGIKPTDSAG